MSSGMRVAAVVVTYHRPVELRQVITALLGQTRPAETVIVIDNGGPERAADLLADFGDRLDMVHSPENLGGAGGFAEGLRRGLAANADWIWLMDDDAIPASDALACLLTVLPALPANPGALACAVREYGDWAVRHRRRFNRWTGWETSLSRVAYEQPHAEMDTGSFVGWLVSAQAVRQVGLPETDFFMAYDDTDYSLRLRAAGWRQWLVPGSVIEHLRSPAARLHSSAFGGKHYYNIRNRLIVKRRHARLRTIATVDALAHGVVLWLWTQGWRHAEGWQLGWRALADGLSGRLGKAPLPVASPPLALHHFPANPRGAVVIRTQGRRPELLSEALASVAEQGMLVTPWVVVHGDAQQLVEVRESLEGRYPNAHLLHASDTAKHRGYPLNVALKEVYAAGDAFDYLFFLDDDDRVYPTFCAQLTAALRDHAADVAYAASHQRVPGQAPSLAYAPLPIACLLFENFLPINSYAIRLAAIRTARPLFDETLEVLEDWNFLHQLLALQLRFTPVAAVLSEFSLTGDGNTPEKQNQPLWDRAWEGVHRYLDQFWCEADPKYVLSAFRDFNFSTRPPLTPNEIRKLEGTRQLLKERYAEAWIDG